VIFFSALAEEPELYIPQHLLKEMFERWSSVDSTENAGTGGKIRIASLLNALRPTLLEFVELIES